MEFNFGQISKSFEKHDCDVTCKMVLLCSPIFFHNSPSVKQHVAKIYLSI